MAYDASVIELTLSVEKLFRKTFMGFLCLLMLVNNFSKYKSSTRLIKSSRVNYCFISERELQEIPRRKSSKAGGTVAYARRENRELPKRLVEAWQAASGL